METVLVFKTSIQHSKEVQLVKNNLDQLMNNNGTWNFDLEDCDNILRVETHTIPPETIRETLRMKGFSCEELM